MLCFLTHRNKNKKCSKFKETKHVALDLIALPSVSSPAPPAAAPPPCHCIISESSAIGSPYESLADDWPDHCQFH